MHSRRRSRRSRKTICGRRSRLLSSMEGVGRGGLLLTTTGSDETFTRPMCAGPARQKRNHRLSANQSAQKNAVVTKTKKASYAGTVVVCDGQTAQWSGCALCGQFPPSPGLGSDKISVIKMKQS